MTLVKYFQGRTNPDMHADILSIIKSFQNVSFSMIYFALLCELFLLHIYPCQLNSGFISICMLCWLVHRRRDLMWQQPTLVYVWDHSRTSSCHTHWLWQLLLSPSSLSWFSPPPLCLYFTSLQTDSENRSLVRWRLRDGNRQGWALCKKCHAILMTLWRAKPAL